MLSSISFTAADIDAMQAGRDLDALIVSFVFEVADFDYRDYKNPHFPIKKFSTDIAAAWEVVEKHPHYFSLTRSNDTNWKPAPFGPMVWRCRFYAPEKFEAVADTVPLAICRAALRAVLSTQ